MLTEIALSYASLVSVGNAEYIAFTDIISGLREII